jgi:hypothetical protein
MAALDLSADAAADSVGKKRLRTCTETSLSNRAPKKNRQDDVIRAMGEDPVTERHILEV